MSAKGAISNPTGNIAWAIDKLQEFKYRERFHLSYSDFLEEPLEVFSINTYIMSVEGELQRQEQRRANRAGRSRRGR